MSPLSTGKGLESGFMVNIPLMQSHEIEIILSNMLITVFIYLFAQIPFLTYPDILQGSNPFRRHSSKHFTFSPSILYLYSSLQPLIVYVYLMVYLTRLSIIGGRDLIFVKLKTYHYYGCVTGILKTFIELNRRC